MKDPKTADPKPKARGVHFGSTGKLALIHLIDHTIKFAESHRFNGTSAAKRLPSIDETFERTMLPAGMSSRRVQCSAPAVDALPGLPHVHRSGRSHLQDTISCLQAALHQGVAC